MDNVEEAGRGRDNAMKTTMNVEQMRTARKHRLLAENFMDTILAKN